MIFMVGGNRMVSTQEKSQVALVKDVAFLGFRILMIRASYKPHEVQRVWIKMNE